MLAGHARHLNRRRRRRAVRRGAGVGRGADVHPRRLEGVQGRHGGEGLAGVGLGAEVRLGVRRGDDGYVTAQGGFDLLIEVVAGVHGERSVVQSRSGGRGQQEDGGFRWAEAYA